MGLFMMLKVGGKVAGTDQGWVYGVVSGDGTKVLASGKDRELHGLPRQRSWRSPVRAAELSWRR